MNDSRYTPPQVPVADVSAGTGDEVTVPDTVLKKIRNASIAAVIAGAITLVLAAMAMSGNPTGGHTSLDAIDALLVFGMAYGIHRKSRVCATLMLCYFVLSKYLLFKASGQASGLLSGFVFLYFYAMGVQGTFEYHKLRKG